MRRVKYPPSEGNYKSLYYRRGSHAFAWGIQCSLKDVGRAAEACYFILATTDPQKIPATILSRCQRFDFRRINASEIAKTLGSYAEKEQISVTEEALYLVARLCRRLHEGCAEYS